MTDNSQIVATRGDSAGVIGLGLMGTSIAAALLSAGHRLTSLTYDAKQRSGAHELVGERLREMKQEGILRDDPEELLAGFRVTDKFEDLADCSVVIESIIEDMPAKLTTLRKVEEAVSPETLVGSNTSAIPVTLLQEGALHPGRIVGIHWAEPAHVTRFMEIICGNQTLPEYAERAMKLARGWGKEPTLVRRDIRGFITNRIMYAILREAFFLVDNGYATPADVDRSMRNDMGCWMTFAGPFRFMDLTGIPAYGAVMKDLFPELNCETEVPQTMKKLLQDGALGVSNGKGFYNYTPEQAKRWEALFLKFNYEIRALAHKYPENVGD